MKTVPRLWCAILAIILSQLALGTAAHADELRPGYLELTEQTPNSWRMVWKAPIKSGLAIQASPILPDICARSDMRRELVGQALVTIEVVNCSGPLSGQIIGLEGIDTSFSDALLRISALGRPVQVSRLTPSEPSVTVLEKPSSWQVAKSYFILGVEHILAGYDHLLFVLALVLLIRGGWMVAKTVTAFTVAHSITLIGTSLGLIGLPRASVEACIALSIIFLAVEIVKAKLDSPRLSERWPWLVAFAFGLLHGFGFAGALAEIGLPESDVPIALLTFNIGVEIGQLVIVSCGLIALYLIRRFAQPLLVPAKLTTAYAIGGIATYWFIERMIS